MVLNILISRGYFITNTHLDQVGTRFHNNHPVSVTILFATWDSIHQVEKTVWTPSWVTSFLSYKLRLATARDLEIIGIPSNLTSSSHQFYYFNHTSSNNNDTYFLQTEIAALCFNIFCEYCGTNGHKADSCIIRGSKFLPPSLREKMNQSNALNGDEPSLQQAGIPITDLEPNIEYILGLTNYNGIINHSSQHTVYGYK